MAKRDGHRRLKCPSAPARHGRCQPRLAYLNAGVPVSEDILQSTAPLPPARVLRIAAGCEERLCAQFRRPRLLAGQSHHFNS
ncbi:MAG: hypothetical protein WDN06_04735 [Asticcacaulis sp.]